jgi:hypothetical protein
MDEVQKHSNSECYTPLLEAFSIYLDEIMFKEWRATYRCAVILLQKDFVATPYVKTKYEITWSWY